MVRVIDEGSDECGDFDWGDDSLAICPECDFQGEFVDFTIPPSPIEKLAEEVGDLDGDIETTDD